MSWTDVQLALHAWAVAATGYPAGQVIWGGQGSGRPFNGSTPVPGAVLRVMADLPLGDDAVTQEPNPLVVADLDVDSVDATANTFDVPGHGLVSGDGPLLLATTGTRPAPIAAGQEVYALVVDADTLKLSASAKDAVHGVAIDLTDVGTGVHTIVDTPDTVRAGQELLLTARGMRMAVLSVQAYAGPPPSGDLATGENSPFARLSRMKSHANLPSRVAALKSANVGVSVIGDVRATDGQLGPALAEPRASMEVRLFHSIEEQEFGSYAETLEYTNTLTGTVKEIAL